MIGIKTFGRKLTSGSRAEGALACVSAVRSDELSRCRCWSGPILFWGLVARSSLIFCLDQRQFAQSGSDAAHNCFDVFLGSCVLPEYP